MTEKVSRAFILDAMLAMSAYWACSGTVVASLSAYHELPLALSNFAAGLSSTLLLLQPLGSLAYAKAKNPFRFLRLTNGGWRVFLPLAFFSVALPRALGAPLMLAAYALAVGIYHFACPAQTEWMVDCTQGGRGDFYSSRETCFMLAFTAIYCVVGLRLDRAAREGTQRAGFLAVGALEAVLLAASLAVLLRLPAPARQSGRQVAPAAPSLLAPLRNVPFRKVTLASMLWNFSSMFIGGFGAVYQISVLQVSFFQIMLWSTVGNLLRALCTPLAARLARRIGWHAVTALTIVMMAGTAPLWMLATPENAVFLFPLLSILGALPYAGMGVGFLELQVATSPAEGRSMFFSVYSLLGGAAALCGSLGCSVLVGVLESRAPGALRWVFSVGMAVAACAAWVVARIRVEKSGKDKLPS